MSIRVFKYQLKVQDHQKVSIPRGMKPLKVAAQHGVICLWAEVYDDNPVIDYDIWIHGTGHEVMGHTHLGSVMLSDDILVFHVYWGTR